MARMSYFLIVLIISLTISNSIQCKYDNCPDPWNPRKFIDHTMCQYSEASFGPECNNGVRFSSLVDSEIKAILHVHNELRAKVAAGKESRGLNGGQPAGVIAPLEWDNELALVAQRWANQCEFEHDKCRDVGGMKIGQNLGFQSYSNDFNGEFVDIVDDWYSEVEYFDGSLVPNYQLRNGMLTGHYTQMIWAKTTRVGCGGVKYYDGEYYTNHLVCNYGPGGNMIGDSVYPFGGEPKKQLNNNPDVEVPPNEWKY